jgi:hypothetical protein
MAQDPSMYPDVKALGKALEFLTRFDGDTQELFDRAWTEIGVGQ